MPEFIVVQCHGCELYQVCQRRKDGKFNCKVCGSKQSVRAILARSENASQLRPVVQNINYARGNAEIDFEHAIESGGIKTAKESSEGSMAPEDSRWKLLAQGHRDDEAKESQPTSDGEYSDDNQFVTTLPDVRKGRRNKMKRLKPDTGSSAKSPSQPSHPISEQTGFMTNNNTSIPDIAISPTADDRSFEQIDVATEGYSAIEVSPKESGSLDNQNDEGVTDAAWGNGWGETERSVWG